jgi:hypothetical protein
MREDSQVDSAVVPEEIVEFFQPGESNYLQHICIWRNLSGLGSERRLGPSGAGELTECRSAVVVVLAFLFP